MRLLRLAKILNVCRRHGIDVLILEHEPSGKLAALARLLGGGKRCTAPRGERLRLALESLGPIFVKFGQVLSTRRDLLPLDIADELAKLQDRVPSFPFDQVKTQVEAAYGKPVQEVFAEAYADVEKAFEDAFSRLFPGGEGRLVLTTEQIVEMLRLFQAELSKKLSQPLWCLDIPRAKQCQ